MSTILTLHDPQVARRYYAEGYWREDTLYTLLRRHARERPDAFAFRDGRRRLTWRALLDWVDALAADLHAAGLKRGQRVSVWLPNRVEPVVVLLACSRNGYVCNPSLHQNYTVSDVVQLMQRIQTVALFAQPGYGADAGTRDVFSAAAALPGMKRVYAVGSDRVRADCTAFPVAAATAAQPPAVDENPDKVVYLAFTSGTTGTPKGVLHSDNTLLANGRAMVKDWRHDEHTVLYSHSPLSHHIATVAIEQSLVAGFEVVVNDPPSGMKPLDWIVESGATYVMGVPTHAIDLLATTEAARPHPAGARQRFLHGRLDHSAGHRARVPGHGCKAAERVRDERERLPSVHDAGRRRNDDHHDVRKSVQRLRDAVVGSRESRCRSEAGRDRRDRHARRPA